MKYRFALLLGLVSSSVFAASTFEGVYQCEGTDPYLNKKYSGTLTITPQNTVYQISMKYDTGEELRGTGGQYNNQLLSVVFQDVHDLKKTGLEQYQWSEDKTRMGGYWVYLGKDKLGTEVCEKKAT